MPLPVKVVDIELSAPLVGLEGLDGYNALQAILRLSGVPVGYIKLPVSGGRCSRASLIDAIVGQNAGFITDHLLNNRLAGRGSGGPFADDLFCAARTETGERLPLVTVAVCTRDRASDLARCLDAIKLIDYPSLDVLIIDNAPSSDETMKLVRGTYPWARYVRESRPGLNWARNRAVIEARGEIIAYTDDDAVVDPGWVAALVRVFSDSPGVMCVTGLVAPYELETEAQALFELYGGFGRGFKRKWYWVDVRGGERAALLHGGAGKFGTGANMAYRRRLFDEIGRFDVALDVGTVTNGGGDLDMFFRVLKEGYTLVYEPGAIVRHRHRRDYGQLRTQLANNGIGFYSYIVRNALHYRDERAAFMRLGLWWFWWWNIRRFLISFVRPSRFPRDLIVAELLGSLTGLSRYKKSRRIAAEIAATPYGEKGNQRP